MCILCILLPDYLTEMFVDRSNVRSYTLRDKEGKLAELQPRTNYLKKSFRYRSAVTWNTLQLAIYVNSSVTEGISYINFQILIFILVIERQSWKTSTLINVYVYKICKYVFFIVVL